MVKIIFFYTFPAEMHPGYTIVDMPRQISKCNTFLLPKKTIRNVYKSIG